MPSTPTKKRFFDQLEQTFTATQSQTHKTLGHYVNRIFNEGYDTHSPGIYVKKAKGCYIEDHDGNIYIDTALGAGTAILGHANPLIIEPIREQLAKGTLFAAPSLLAQEFGKLLQLALPWFGGFAFCNTGTEATMRAIRISRAVTGKKKIAVFSGGWHGTYDNVLVDEDYNGPENAPTPKFRSAGIPQDAVADLLFLPFNSSAAFELIHTHANELSAVLIEPSQGSNPRNDLSEFLRELRHITTKLGILLCFDEIITGFRVALGGAQALYGVHADLATYGKVIGGGAPSGLVAGRTEIMHRIHGDGSKHALPVFMGGTFSANPVTMAAGISVLTHLIENNKHVYETLDSNSRALKENVNEFCISENIPARMMGFGSMLRLIFSAHPIASRRDRDEQETSPKVQRIFRMAMLLSKVYTAENGLIFLSTSHDLEIIKILTKEFNHNLQNFSRLGAWNDD